LVLFSFPDLYDVINILLYWFYNNTLIDADTNLPTKNIVSILRHFLISEFSSFCWWVQHLFARGLRVTLLRYYLGIGQILMRGSPKKKFAVKGRDLVHCGNFSDNGKAVQMRMSEL